MMLGRRGDARYGAPVQVERSRGTAADFHARPIPDPVGESRAWVFELARPAIVLGSSQRDGVVDATAAAAAGVDVVRRRSGGGLVMLEPGACLWVDLVIGPDDPQWIDDVSVAAFRVGELWRAALAELGATGATVHRGGLVRAPWSDVVCFASLGPGEVSIERRKVVGISQRRTRVGARFQCLVFAEWNPARMLDLVAVDAEVRAAMARDLSAVAAGPGVTLDALESAVLARAASVM